MAPAKVIAFWRPSTPSPGPPAKTPYRFTNRRPGDIDMFYADQTLAAKELDWRAERDLETMCKDTWRWQSQNPNGYR